MSDLIDTPVFDIKKHDFSKDSWDFGTYMDEIPPLGKLASVFDKSVKDNLKSLIDDLSFFPGSHFDSVLSTIIPAIFCDLVRNHCCLFIDNYDDVYSVGYNANEDIINVVFSHTDTVGTGEDHYQLRLDLFKALKTFYDNNIERYQEPSTEDFEKTNIECMLKVIGIKLKEMSDLFNKDIEE